MLTKKGYIRKKYKGKMRMEHSVVWEKHNGKIPKGFQIHHIDSDKTNNDIKNLQLLTPSEHKRMHSGWKKINGKYLKPCVSCKKLKEERLYYKNKKTGFIYSECKDCSIKRATTNKKKRRLKSIKL